MANILSESVSVSQSGALVRVDFQQIHDDGVDMGGALVLDAANAPWLAAEVDKAAGGWGYERVEQGAGPDHFTVYVGGGDYQQFVHVHNERDAAAPEGKLYAIGLSLDVARTLASQLAAVG